jgi:hypothetical protein
MEIRGERECLDCGETWSYFETREPACPECGSLRSRSVEEAEEDTAGGVETADLLTRFGGDFDAALEEAEDRCREYTSRAGFVEGGELLPPSPVYVMACEVKHVAAEFVGEREPTDDEREYVVALVEGVEKGEPPSTEGRPESLDAAHRRSVAETVEEYAVELSRYLRSVDETDGRVEEARDLAKRTQATDGEADDAVEGLRLLRDVYEDLTPSEA